MRNRSFHFLLPFCIATLFSVVTVFAQDHSALVGKWNMVSETEGDSIPWTLVLKETDGKLGATLVSEDSQVTVEDFSYEGGVLKFKAPYQGQDYLIELKLTGAELNGTWSGGDASGKTHGAKTS